MLQTPGRLVQSVAQASFDAWVKYYRSDENTPNATVSYYTKGALVALCFDLTLRADGKRLARRRDAASLERRAAAARSTRPTSPPRSKRSAAARSPTSSRAWVHGTGELPLADCCSTRRRRVAARAGDARAGARRAVAESARPACRSRTCCAAAPPSRPALAAGDEILALRGWRMRRLDDAVRLLDGEAEAPLLVARDQRVLTLPLILAERGDERGAVALRAGAEAGRRRARALSKAWLAG